MTNVHKALQAANFGSRIAEDDTELHSYFVETEQWRKILNGDIDIVFGAKGAGKSALYSLLVGREIGVGAKLRNWGQTLIDSQLIPCRSAG